MMNDDSTATTPAETGAAAPGPQPAKKTVARKRATRAAGRPAAKKAAAAEAPAAKAPAVKAPAAKAPAVKAPAAEAPAVKAPATQAAVKKAPARKSPARKSPARKAGSPGSASPAGFGATASSGVVQAGSEQELAGHEVDPDYVGTDHSLDRDPHDHPMDLEEGVAGFARSVGGRGKPAAKAFTVPVSKGPASAEDVEAAWKDNTLAQVLYHDWEAETYDEKWGISFDERCISYAKERFSALVGADVLRAERWPYQKALEIGAGTGFFSLNLRQAGVLDEVYVTDVSPGMVEAAKRNAKRLGFEVQGEAAFAEHLPYPDDTFDVVVGHAVIHHIPDVESALREILRVLKPGGRFVIAGEPTRVGDWYARRLGRVTWKLTTGVTRLGPLRERWARSQEELDASSRAAVLEAVVDLHTFVPDELAAMATRAGAQGVHTQTEEFLAALLGWPVRTFEAAVNPERLGWGWAMFAYKSWLRLSAVDRVLSRALPKGVFYNVGLTGTKTLR